MYAATVPTHDHMALISTESTSTCNSYLVSDRLGKLEPLIVGASKLEAFQDPGNTRFYVLTFRASLVWELVGAPSSSCRARRSVQVRLPPISSTSRSWLGTSQLQMAEGPREADQSSGSKTMAGF